MYSEILPIQRGCLHKLGLSYNPDRTLFLRVLNREWSFFIRWGEGGSWGGQKNFTCLDRGVKKF